MSELPKGWINTKIEDVTEYVQRGKSPKYVQVSDLPVINQKCIRWSGVDARYLKFIHPDQWDSWASERFLREGDILWNSTGTGTIGRAALYKHLDGYEKVVADSHVTIVRANAACQPSFLHYFIRSSFVQSKIEDMQSGSTNQVELSRGQVLNTAIPLAPLNEQKRIADKLDRILARVDACREKCDRIPLILKRFRQSVLAAATSGELTEDWRNANLNTETASGLLKRIEGELAKTLTKQSKVQTILSDNSLINQKLENTPDSWQVALVRDICENSFYGPRFGKNEYVEHGIPSIRTTDMNDNGEIILKAPPMLNIPANRLDGLKLLPNDLLVTRSGSIGVMAVFRGNYLAIPSAYLIRFRFSRQMLVDYIFYYLKSPVGQQLIESSTTAITQVNINAEAIKNLPILIPPSAEQQEIVRRVKVLFAYADRLEARYQTARAQCDQLTPALLEKAFQGELVPQDPNDEPASALLERIQAERSSAEANQTKPKRSKESSGKPSHFKIIMLTRKEIQPSHLSDILKSSGTLTAEALWTASQLAINDFYDQLKDEEVQGLLKETKAENPTAPRLLEVA